MKKFTLGITFCLFQILFFSAVSINAQKNAETILPIFPVIAEYEYAPVYLGQDIKNHSQYAEIKAIFDPVDASSVEIILIEKTTKKRIFYCNSESNFRKRKMQGYDANFVKIDFKPSVSNDQLPIYGFGFQDKKGQPVLWRVIPTGKPSNRGAGINGVDDDSALRIEYRDFGTTVGEGTAVKIGDKIFEAEPWTEISSPPYFYAFHGTFTIGRHLGALRLGNENWSVTSRPNKLKKGEKWILTNGKGLKRTLKIVSDHQNELVIDEINPTFKNASQRRIVLHMTPKGYNLRSVKMNNRKKEMHIKFEPELPIQTSSSTDFEGEFMINQGEKKSVITGTIIRKQISANSISLNWMPKSPNWAKSNPLEAVIRFEANGYSILTKNSGVNP